METLTQAAPAAAPAAAGFAAHSIDARATFAVPSSARPVTYTSALTGGVPHYVGAFQTLSVQVHDGRPEVDTHSLDREGFVLRRHATAVDDFYDDAELTAVYDHEIERLLKAETGASRVLIFDRTRRTDGPVRDGDRGPARYVHNDYTELSGAERARTLLAQRGLEHLADRRVAQVNVWRPIVGPVRRSPLAFVDAWTVRRHDLIATDMVYPDRTGEIYHLAHRPDQRWVYFPRMARDEVVLIKGYDSADDGRARFTPHVAAEDPATPTDAPARESIEVRTLLLFDEPRA